MFKPKIYKGDLKRIRTSAGEYICYEYDESVYLLAVDEPQIELTYINITKEYPELYLSYLSKNYKPLLMFCKLQGWELREDTGD